MTILRKNVQMSVISKHEQTEIDNMKLQQLWVSYAEFT